MVSVLVMALRRAGMASMREKRKRLAHKVIEVFNAHPNDSSAMLAARLGVRREYIRATLNRRGLTTIGRTGRSDNATGGAHV